MRRRTKSRIAFCCAALLAVAAASISLLLTSWREAAITPPSPSQSDSAVLEQDAGDETQNDPFPVVDWEYWQGVNEDVIGWITVPGTTINSPVLQATESDPDYYLNHDVYGDYNPHGAIYLDADCKDGLLGRNAVIMGHHYGNDVDAAPFSIIAEYKDEDFASGHTTVYLQTPTWRKTYEVRFAQIVNGLERNKFTSFADDAEFKAWYDSSRNDASMVLDSQSEPRSVISLVSCSYNIWVANERTVVIASEKDGPQISGHTAADSENTTPESSENATSTPEQP